VSGHADSRVTVLMVSGQTGAHINDVLPVSHTPIALQAG
jgi:hypothetical protein